MDKIFAIVKDDQDLLLHCVKGDVLKSFRTIKEMCQSGNCLNKFADIRKRILSHKKKFFKWYIFKANKNKNYNFVIIPIGLQIAC